MTFKQFNWCISLLDNPSSYIHHPEFEDMKLKMIETIKSSRPEDVFELMKYDFTVGIC